MRADQRRLAAQLGLERSPASAAASASRGCAARAERDVRRVGDRRRARASPASVRTRPARPRRDVGDERRARAINAAPGATQLVVVRQQQRAVGRDRAAQQRRLLLHDLGVARQVAVVRRRELGQRAVEKRAPQRRTAGDELQVGRHERDDPRAAEEAARSRPPTPLTSKVLRAPLPRRARSRRASRIVPAGMRASPAISARGAPSRISSISRRARNDLPVASIAIASSRLLFPCALGPTKTFKPGAGAKSSVGVVAKVGQTQRGEERSHLLAQRHQHEELRAEIVGSRAAGSRPARAGPETRARSAASRRG